jgi:cell division protease FtsH
MSPPEKTPKNQSTKNRPERGKEPGGPNAMRNWLAPIALALLLLWAVTSMQKFIANKPITYSEFRGYVDRGEVVEARISGDYIEGRIVRKVDEPKKEDAKKDAAAKTDEKTPPEKTPAEKKTDAKTKTEPGGTTPSVLSPALTDAEREFHFRTIRVEDPNLAETLISKGVKFEGERPSFLTTYFFMFILPLLLLVAVWMFVMRRLGSAGESVLSFSRNRARLVAEKDISVTFNDVAGCQEAKEELQEVVEFLRAPDKYEALGAKIPKGVLLVGPPGTGKTLLARAIAGEAKVPFFSISGSDFVEMFVGVGAARVRDLFGQAKKHAPCIIFIDEMDAIGRQRGVHVGAVNDEREQTLNQLLVEMDGFEANLGVILLAATNRPDVLDRALLRPGRFDRQVVVDAPDLEGRLAILKVHARNKKVADDVDLRMVAQSTPGFSGADLANTLNEAALLAVRRGHDLILQIDLEEAIEKVYAGPERRSRRITEQDKKKLAYHEGGHAMVAFLTNHGERIRRITIVPRGRAAGYVSFMGPEDDRIGMSKGELMDDIRRAMGGRAAEEIVFSEIDAGAVSDLNQATNIARRMVTMYGMGESVGLMHCAERNGPMYLSGETTATHLDCSEQTARDIDLEVKKLLESCYNDVKRMLIDNRGKLDKVADELIRVETLDAKQFLAIVGEQALGAEAELSPTEEKPKVEVVIGE